MDSRDWILKNVNLTKEDLFAKRRKDKATSNKRWVVMCFFRAMGKSYPAIAKQSLWKWTKTASNRKER